MFLTRLSPSTSKEVLARNNYNNAFMCKLDKVTCYVKLLVPVYELKWDFWGSLGRDIFWIEGKNILLENYNWGFGCLDMGGLVWQALQNNVKQEMHSRMETEIKGKEQLMKQLDQSVKIEISFSYS